jgi:hypothetical protein
VFELWDMPLESSGGTQTVGGGDVIAFSEVRFSYPGKGRHHELLQRGGRYAVLYGLQFMGEEKKGVV